MAWNEEGNTNMPVVDDFDDRVDLSFLFQDDVHYGDQSLLPENNHTMMSTYTEPTILDTNMPSYMNVIPADIIHGSNNKRTRDCNQEETISPRKRFKPLETLENPNYHQETTTHAYSNPSPSTLMAIFGGSRRKTPIPWTIEEHVRFLIRIAQGYKGDWKTISRVYVRTRTAAQVTSHAQKHFLHQHKRSNNGNGSANPIMMTVTKGRSIYDVASLADVEISKLADAYRYVRSPINH